MLIISTVKGLPEERTRINTIAQAIFLLPGLICAPVLATSGVDITITTNHTTIKDLNSTQTWSETDSNAIVLQNPIWVTVNMMIFFVLFFYIVRQILLLLMAEA